MSVQTNARAPESLNGAPKAPELDADRQILADMVTRASEAGVATQLWFTQSGLYGELSVTAVKCFMLRPAIKDGDHEQPAYACTEKGDVYSVIKRGDAQLAGELIDPNNDYAAEWIAMQTEIAQANLDHCNRICREAGMFNGGLQKQAARMYRAWSIRPQESGYISDAPKLPVFTNHTTRVNPEDPGVNAW